MLDTCNAPSADLRTARKCGAAWARSGVSLADTVERYKESCSRYNMIATAELIACCVAGWQSIGDLCARGSVAWERLRDLVAMGPLYSCRGVGISAVDQQLISLGLVQIWDRDQDGWISVADTDEGRSRICSHSAA